MDTEESKQKKKKTQRTAEIEKEWDTNSAVYAANAEPYTISITLKLATQTKSHEAHRVLEVGCGTGLGSLSVLPQLLPGAVYCCLDISRKMLELMQARYKDSGFAHDPRNALHFSLDAPAGTLRISPASLSEKGVTLQAYRGNCEDLPFADGVFDSYIAAASLHLVESAPHMLRECYRVLRQGGMAGFTVGGREAASPYTAIGLHTLQRYAKKYGVDLGKGRSYFYLGEDDAALVKMCKDAGFSKVSLWHEDGVVQMGAKEFVQVKRSTMGGLVNKFPAEVREEIYHDMEEQVRTRFEEGDELLKLDFIVIVCRK